MAFLGDKYLQPEQVITGNVQTFRAREAATGRSVFVHRIAETAQPEQAALLKLLLSCLYRSSAVKELVLDVREEGDVCFVVTESVPQCLLLREWLQFESERSDPGMKSTGGEAALRHGSGAPVQRPPLPAKPQRPAPHPAVMKPSAPARPAPGEFTRMFQAVDPSKFETISQQMSPPARAPIRPVTTIPPGPERPPRPTEVPGSPEIAAPSPGEFTRLFQTPLQAPATPQMNNNNNNKDVPEHSLRTAQPSNLPGSVQSGGANAHREPGEFTRLFQAPAQAPSSGSSSTGFASSEAASPRFISLEPAASNPKPEPGEFTRFFGGSSPASSREGVFFPAVQRPVSPPNVTAPPQSPGEFTQLFSGEKPNPIASAPSLPPYSASSTPVEFFRQPPAGPASTAGEFTRIFGGGTDRPSSPGASNSGGEYTQLFGTNDPAPGPAAFGANRNVPAVGEPGLPIQPPLRAPQAPSEFTRVVMGPATPAAPVPPAAPPGVHTPAVSAPPIPAAPPAVAPAAQVPAPQISKKPNRALLLLFLILFVLAAALVVVIAVAAKR